MATRDPLFSIVTVCRNAATEVAPTMNSVKGQSLRDYEYIVVDGASTDATPQVVRSFGGLVTTFVSEPDAGIYDAMNKGVRLARGRWVYFLNANDFFVDERVLERVAAQIARKPEALLAYGDVFYRTDDAAELLRFCWLTRWNLRFEHLCHQAVFANRVLFERVGAFDTGYRINADYDWLLRAFDSGAGRLYLGFPIASYDTSGISSTESESKRAERHAVRRKHLPRLLGAPLHWMYRAYRRARHVSRSLVS